MSLLNDINRNRRNYKKTVKDALVWYDENYKSRTSKAVVKVPNNQYLRQGKLYRFAYVPIKSNVPYYDANPLIIALGTQIYKGSKMDLGLNLNLLPFDIKIRVLDKIFSNYKHVIENSINSNPDDAMKQKGTDISFDDLNHMFPKFNLSFAIRNYSKIGRFNTGVIAYENFLRIPFLESFKIRHKTIGYIHSQYYQSLKKRK